AVSKPISWHRAHAVEAALCRHRSLEKTGCGDVKSPLQSVIPVLKQLLTFAIALGSPSKTC
ncbi:MAG TPA: hypothetical protein VGX94_08570, partial [Terriglobia bacterium]|nr:hypothetical protein [Terriglobia bacterium]